MTRFFEMLTGLLVWSAQFGVIYGFTAVACARGYAQASLFGIGVVPLTVIAATLVALAITGLVFARDLAERPRLRDAHPTDRFLNYGAILIGGLSLVAIAWNGLPALIVPACV